jgi:LysR family transcriptional regulator, cyn operon transcriptional activator
MLLRHIRYLLAVAEHRNFTRAADALHVSQPTLSQQIRQLEEMLGAQLFDRSGRTVKLTDAGEAYVRYAQRALQDLEAGKRAIHDVQELSRGSLRLAVTPTFTAYLIGPLLEKYNRRYPALTLHIVEMPQERMETLLSEDAIDVGIAFSDVQSVDIEAQELLVEPLAMMVGKAHPYARSRAPRTLKEVRDEGLVLLNGEFATRHYIDRYFRQHGITPRIVIEVNSISAVIELVSRSKLATILPADIAREHRELLLVDLKPAPPKRTAALLLRKDAWRSAATKAFIALALEEAGG